MNIRKPVDYSQMYEALDNLLVSSMEQTKLFCEIGKVIDERPEKGAAVAAAEYINTTCPEKSGFSPRSLRRMRDFYRAYKTDPDLMARAMNISWSLNAVIIENCKEHDVRKWYVMACLKHGWSKQELCSKINEKAHENSVLDINDMTWYTKTNNRFIVERQFDEDAACPAQAELPNSYCSFRDPKRGQDGSGRRSFQRFFAWNLCGEFLREIFLPGIENSSIRLYRLFPSTGIVDRIQQLLWERIQIAEVCIS